MSSYPFKFQADIPNRGPCPFPRRAENLSSCAKRLTGIECRHNFDLRMVA
jgi:hypothetical protein